MDPGVDVQLPPEHSLVAAVKALNVELVNEILDTHKIDLNALSAAALAHRPHRAGHPMSLSGGILHSITSMDALSITPMDVLGAAVIDHAMLSNARAIFEKLLECGASPACTDWDGFTPLHWACTCAVDWAILALIRAGAPVNATSRDGDTPLHCLFKRRPGRLGGDAVQRLVAPLLDAGADPTARRGDGLRPFDMLFRFSHCGPAAVQAERDGLLTECRPSNIVAGKLAIPGVGWAPVGSSLFRCQSPRPDRGDRRFGRAVLERHTPAGSEATNSSDEQLDRRSDRWPEAAVAELREKAHELDARRRSFVRGIRTLLLWRCREARRGPGGSPVHLLPEEVLFQVVLLACEDSGVRDDWRRCFAEIGEQASVQTTYSHRLRALSAWTTASSDVDEEKRELLLQQLSGQYDEARAALARLRRAGDKAEWAARPHARALRAVQEFVAAARPVLYGCGEDGE